MSRRLNIVEFAEIPVGGLLWFGLRILKRPVRDAAE